MRVLSSIVAVLISAITFSQVIKELPPLFVEEQGEEQMRLFVNADVGILNSLQSAGHLKIILERGAYQLIATDKNGLNELVDSGGLKYVNTSYHKGTPLNDVMITNNNILPAHQGAAPLNSALSGEGVIMGIIDTGVELLHPDFLNEDGTTRIIELWDHTFEYDEEHIPEPYGFGTRWTAEEINEGLAVHQDQAIWYGHGSTVTGTACGNGSAVNDFKGVAPNSDMVIVSFDFGTPNFLEDVSLAVQYIFDVADEQGKPCVINMSLGTYFGSHDGLDAAALFIDDLLEEPGRLMAAAVGNSNTLAPYHLGVDIEEDTVFTWFEFENSLGVGGNGMFFELWADTADMANISFSLGADRTENPFSVRGTSDAVSYQESLGSVVSRQITNTNDEVLGIVQYWSQYRGAQVQMQVFVSNPDSTQYDFRFTAMGTGAFDVWSTSAFGTSDMIGEDALPSESEFPDIIQYRTPDKRMHMVSSWTCSDKVTTVANYVNRVSYVDYAGNITTLPGTQGDIHNSSSAGPTRDGRQKPDIAATGSMTLSTGNFAVLEALIQNEPFKVAQGGMHFRNGGSSMASPVVAGIMALYLEQCPEANWEDFKEALVDAAAVDGYTAEVPNIYWGHGKVNGYGTLAFDAIELEVFQDGDELIASGGDSYQWYLDAEPIDGETGPTLVISNSGAYLVEAFNDAGCSLLSDPIVVTGLDNYSLPSMTIIPNPTSEEFTIKGILLPTEMVIMDSYGKQVKRAIISPSTRIDVTDLSKGLYLLEIRSEDSKQIKKLIIE